MEDSPHRQSTHLACFTLLCLPIADLQKSKECLLKSKNLAQAVWVFLVLAPILFRLTSVEEGGFVWKWEGPSKKKEKVSEIVWKIITSLLGKHTYNSCGRVNKGVIYQPVLHTAKVKNTACWMNVRSHYRYEGNSLRGGVLFHQTYCYIFFCRLKVNCVGFSSIWRNGCNRNFTYVIISV